MSFLLTSTDSELQYFVKSIVTDVRYMVQVQVLSTARKWGCTSTSSCTCAATLKIVLPAALVPKNI